MKRLAMMAAAGIVMGTGLSWAASSDDSFAAALNQGASSIRAASANQGEISPAVAQLLSQLQAGGAGGLQGRPQAPKIDTGMSPAQLNGEIKELYDKGAVPQPEQLLGIREGSCEDTKPVVLVGVLNSMADPVTGGKRTFVKSAMFEREYFEALAQQYFGQMKKNAEEHKQFLPEPGEREYMMLAQEMLSSDSRAAVKFTEKDARVKPLEGMVDAELRETPKGLAASLSHLGFSPQRYYCFFPSGD